MSSEAILKASAAVEELENNSKKLSEITEDLSELKNALESLNSVILRADTANNKGSNLLKSFHQSVEDVQEKLTAELKVRLAEGNAEQSSRLKDANEKLFALEAQITSIKNKIEQLEETGNTIKTTLSKIEETLNYVGSRQKTASIIQSILVISILIVAGKALGVI